MPELRRFKIPESVLVVIHTPRLDVLLINRADALRDVIAFPKTQHAQDMLTQAPGPVDEKQLRALHVRLRNPTAA